MVGAGGAGQRLMCIEAHLSGIYLRKPIWGMFVEKHRYTHDGRHLQGSSVTGPSIRGMLVRDAPVRAHLCGQNLSGNQECRHDCTFE